MQASGVHTPLSPKSMLTYSSADSEEEEEAIEQVEMLLEAFFMNVGERVVGGWVGR